MKKKTIGMLMALAVVVVVSLVWAQTQTTPLDKVETKMEEARMMYPAGMTRACPACGGMMSKQMLATEDGHIIVLVGNTLQKYDADLQLVKETDLKIDMTKMHQHMQDMMKSCPMQNRPMMPK